MAGVRGFLAFWMGGASSGVAVPAPVQVGGATKTPERRLARGTYTPPSRRRIHVQLRVEAAPAEVSASVSIRPAPALVAVTVDLSAPAASFSTAVRWLPPPRRKSVILQCVSPLSTISGDVAIDHSLSKRFEALPERFAEIEELIALLLD